MPPTQPDNLSKQRFPEPAQRGLYPPPPCPLGLACLFPEPRGPFTRLAHQIPAGRHLGEAARNPLGLFAELGWCQVSTLNRAWGREPSKDPERGSQGDHLDSLMGQQQV